MSIQNFIDNFNGGTRKNRFRVKMIDGPEDLQTLITDFHIQAASMPASILTTNPIDYQGRKILYPGDRLYSADGFNVWTMTVLDDVPTTSGNAVDIWTAFHNWSNRINAHNLNTGDTSETSTIVVEQLNLNESGANGGVIKRSTLYECWPQSISTIDMEMQARDQYNSFDVTMCFRYLKYEDLE
jgi:hypothetical protein